MNRSDRTGTPIFKTCPGCEIRPRHQLHASVENFGVNTSRKDGLQVYCKACLAFRRKAAGVRKDAYIEKLERAVLRLRAKIMSGEGHNDQ
ncbi:MAG: hypothetical protein E6R04_04180 [Spirochaetes bacterium]|nr:MAG: hypothetical protein E6R04_04180 [Spirochaetota bacterium]